MTPVTAREADWGSRVVSPSSEFDLLDAPPARLPVG